MLQWLNLLLINGGMQPFVIVRVIIPHVTWGVKTELESGYQICMQGIKDLL